MQPTRRDLLLASAGLGALSLGACHSDEPAERSIDAAQNPAPKGDPDGPWFRISLAQWSNHRTLGRDGASNLEWISSVRDKYDIEAVEFVNQFFFDRVGDWAYLAEMNQRAADAGVEMLLIMIDGQGSLAAEDAAAREDAILKHYKWIVAAAHLGCHSIRVNAAGSGDPAEMQKRAADSLVRLAEFGAPYGMNVIVENHGGWSSNGEWLAGVMRAADHPRVGTLPDFGNFRTGKDADGKDVWYDRYVGVKELMPYAKAVSAKSHAFGAEGEETNTDYSRMLKIVKDAGYRGHVGIEYEGGGHTEDEGILLTRDLLRRVRKDLA